MKSLILNLVIILTLYSIIFIQIIESENVFAVNQKIVDQIKKSNRWEPMEVSQNPFKGWTMNSTKKFMWPYSLNT